MRRANKQLVLGLAVLSVALVLASCASKPPVPSEPPAPAPVAEQSEARDLRARVQRFAFNEAAPTEYQKAEAAFAAAELAFDKNPDEAKAAYLEASAAYRQVIRAGMRAKLDAYRNDLTDQRSQAVTVRADVAARVIFQQAQADWDAAETIFESDNPDDAATLFDKARAGFVQAREEALRLRAQALEALNASDRNKAEVQEKISALEKAVTTEGGTAP